MNEIKTAELTGAALDWAVAKCEGLIKPSFTYERTDWITRYSTDWSKGGQIIEREWVGIETWDEENPWRADKSGAFEQFGTTPLIAAMRCYVASKLGDTVEIPAELLTN